MALEEVPRRQAPEALRDRLEIRARQQGWRVERLEGTVAWTWRKRGMAVYPLQSRH